MSVQSHDLHLLTGVYAVDALTGDELDEFEKHLEQCPTCAEEVRGLRETAARLGLATAIAPPPSMREQVLDATNRVRQLPPSGVRLITADGPRRRRRLSRRLPRPIAVTAMAAAIVALAVLQVGTRHQLQQAQSTNQTIASVLSASDARIQLGSSTVGGTVTAVISKHDREAVITASGMPTPSDARVYQLWVMQRGERPLGRAAAGQQRPRHLPGPRRRRPAGRPAGDHDRTRGRDQAADDHPDRGNPHASVARRQGEWRREEHTLPPLSTYSGPRGLPQAPGRAVESPAEAGTGRARTCGNIGADRVNPLTTRAFDLPDRLAAKADPALIAADERHFAAIADTLEQSIADLTGRLEAELRAPGGIGQKAMDRDTEVHRLSARLRTLRRFGLDLCLGRMVGADDGAGGNPEPVYVGRLGLTDSAGRRLLVDWRSPVAEPFFGATHANPMGLASRRRYRWTRGRVSDYWDEVFTADGLEGHAALDDQSAFIASLGGNRSARMRDVLGTIAADQDAIIRAGSRGALVVDGGPGTGKTVVALHRCAYLLYADPRLGHRRGGVLFVGPHQPYLAYVSDVLPSLGEEGVQTCTLRDLVPEGAAATPETDPEVARLKSSADLVKAIEAAVRFYENPPDQPDDGRDPVVRDPAERRPTGRRRSTRPSPAPRTTRRARRSGPSWSRSRSRTTKATPRPTSCAGRCSRTGSCARPSTGRGR